MGIQGQQDHEPRQGIVDSGNPTGRLYLKGMKNKQQGDQKTGCVVAQERRE
jgi:hypothetical protein